MKINPKLWFKKRWRAVLCVLTTICLALWIVFSYVWLPKGISTVSLLWAADTFHQCSRDTAQTDGSYWVPSARDILDVELRLWDLMDVREFHRLPTARHFVPYQRQYIGFTRNGERLIYVNVFSYADRLRRSDWMEWANWAILGKPVSVCDGGAYYWGVVYNPKTESFEEPHFNG